MRRLGLVALAGLLAGCVTGPPTPPPPLTVEAALARVEVRDDDLRTVAVLSTQAAWPTIPRPYPLVRTADYYVDTFLRAFVTKRTGATTYQVYTILQYEDDWAFFWTAAYRDGAAVRTVPLTVIDRAVLACRYGCSLEEHVAFDVPEVVLQAAAAARTPGATWRFRLSSRRGGDLDVVLPTAEIAALLERVAAYQARDPA